MHDRRWPRRLAAAGLAILLLLPLGVIVANAQELAHQARYVVQPGDTLEGIAAEFGVDPAAILASSAIQDPPYLSPEEIVVIPAPGQSPDEAAWNASQNQGASPFVAGAHAVASGETLADIAASYGIDPWELATFNGISDIDVVSAGQLLRIPAIDGASQPATDWIAAEQTGFDAVGGLAPTEAEAPGGAVFAA
jgi:chitinase